MSHKTLPITLLDFETGGFDAKTNAVTEVAAITFDSETFEEIARYEAILKPYNDDLLYDPQALQVTGITMEMINNGVDFKTFSKEFIAFLKKSNVHSHPKYRPVLAGHNIAFDVPFLQQLLYFIGKKVDEFFNSHSDYFGNPYPKTLDTLPLAMIKWPDMMKHTLGECIQKSGFELVHAHRAMNDVKSNVELLKTFIQSLRNNSVGSVLSVEEERPFRELFKF